MEYFKFIMGLMYLAIGLYLIFTPLPENGTLSYVLAACLVAYGSMRAYMGYQKIFGAKREE